MITMEFFFFFFLSLFLWNFSFFCNHNRTWFPLFSPFVTIFGEVLDDSSVSQITMVIVNKSIIMTTYLPPPFLIPFSLLPISFLSNLMLLYLFFFFLRNILFERMEGKSSFFLNFLSLAITYHWTSASYTLWLRSFPNFETWTLFFSCGHAITAFLFLQRSGKGSLHTFLSHQNQDTWWTKEKLSTQQKWGVKKSKWGGLSGH